jgi:hypothetical protein
MFGGQPEPVPMPWEWAVAQLVAACNYWIAITRPNGRPHTRPVWGIWLNNSLYFSAFGDISLAAQYLAQNSAITVHLESGSKVLPLHAGESPMDSQAMHVLANHVSA